MGLFSSASSGVVNMLKADHKKVKGLFNDFESAEGRERSEIAETTIRELEIHANLEESLIYPAIRKEVKDKAMMNEAIEEHHLVMAKADKSTLKKKSPSSSSRTSKKSKR